jgi:hypothetical protein
MKTIARWLGILFVAGILMGSTGCLLRVDRGHPADGGRGGDRGREKDRGRPGDRDRDGNRGRDGDRSQRIDTTGISAIMIADAGTNR